MPTLDLGLGIGVVREPSLVGVASAGRDDVEAALIVELLALDAAEEDGTGGAFATIAFLIALSNLLFAVKHIRSLRFRPHVN